MSKATEGIQKRFFQVLDEMNQYDTKNGTALIGVCNELVEAKKVKNGGHVTIGVPESVVMDLLLDRNKLLILLVIDRKECEERLKPKNHV